MMFWECPTTTTSTTNIAQAQEQVVAVPHQPPDEPAPHIVVVENQSSRQSQFSTSSDPGNTTPDNTTRPGNFSEPGHTRDNTAECGSSTGGRSGHPSASDSGHTADSGYGNSHKDFTASHSQSIESPNGSFSGTPTIESRNKNSSKTILTYTKLAIEGSSHTPYKTYQIVRDTNLLNHPGIPKLPLPEEWLNQTQLKNHQNIIKPPAEINLASDQNSAKEFRQNKLSSTRSPSLEIDDKSIVMGSAKSVDSEVFGFDPETVRKVEEEGMVMSPKETGNSDSSTSVITGHRSVSTRLNMRSVSETREDQDNVSDYVKFIECSSAKEQYSASKFQFSPRLLADSSMTSPRFFTPPEVVSPTFFAEPSPKSVYYDTVRSPKFFTDTLREDLVPQSPKAFSDNFNRNRVEKPSSKPNSPRVLCGKPSPKIHSYNKENYFTFEPTVVTDNSASRVSPRPKKYGGRNSIEKERFTPADKDNRKYRRHNSCDTNYRNIEVNIRNDENNDNRQYASCKENADVVDYCSKMNSLQIEDEVLRSAQSRRQRLQSISLDSDNARIIEQNLGLPIAKQMKDKMNEAYKKDACESCESVDRHQDSTSKAPAFQFDDSAQKQQTSPELKKKTLRQSCDPQSFLDMPRFSPKEFEIIVTTEEGDAVTTQTKIKKGKNLRNLTIDLTKRDSDLEKELLEFEKLYSDAEEKRVKTPTLKMKATSLDSSETINLSLPQQKTLGVPKNSISVPNTPKKQFKRIIVPKLAKSEFSGRKFGYISMPRNAERRLYTKRQDSGICLRENHAFLMLYQPGTSRMGSRAIGSFDENMTDFVENPPEINVSGICNCPEPVNLGTNLLKNKNHLSVSSTNLKTLPEGVPPDDFEPSAEDEKVAKKLHRRNSNQSLLLTTHSLQTSNCCLTSFGTSCHNLVRASASNFSLNSDNKKLQSLDKCDSISSITNAERVTPMTRVACNSNTNVSETSKKCLLQRRGSNNNLTLNICPTNTLSRYSSNSSLNKETETNPKKGLLERRSSNTSLTLNINTSNAQLSGNRPLSVSNYNLNRSSCNLSRHNSNHSIDNATAEHKKSILQRRSSNTSLTLNIQSQEPRPLEIDESLIEHLKDLRHTEHIENNRKSLSTENLLPKSYKKCCANKGFGSDDHLWSSSCQQDYPQNLTYVGGDPDNEIIYAFGSQDIENFQQGFLSNITTKPLSPQTTSEDFRMYLANMQHLQNASNVLTRQQLRELNDIFQNGFSKVQCHSAMKGQHCCPNKVAAPPQDHSQMIPEPVSSQPCSEYQKKLLRNLHQEFWDMPTNFQEKPIVPGSHPKNRYKTILPNEHSRFILNADAKASEGYINANYIKGYEYSKDSYIATQGPLQNTVFDFWLMVHQNYIQFYSKCIEAATDYNRVQKVVMLTNFIENNRHKCEKYFPIELDEEIIVVRPVCTETTNFYEETDFFKSSFAIKNVGMMKKSGYIIRKLNVRFSKETNSENSDSENSDSEMTVYHYWFHSWADHKCPRDVTALLNLCLDILTDSVHSFGEEAAEQQSSCTCDNPRPSSPSFVFPPLETDSARCEMEVVRKEWDPFDFKQDCSPPIVIHCSAGIGRTGCLIAILNGIKQLASEQKVDVLGIVCNMRLNRGGMVQNSEQYELVHKVLCLFERICLKNM